MRTSVRYDGYPLCELYVDDRSIWVTANGRSSGLVRKMSRVKTLGMGIDLVVAGVRVIGTLLSRHGGAR
jgi:hypothetical protein